MKMMTQEIVQIIHQNTMIRPAHFVSKHKNMFNTKLARFRDKPCSWAESVPRLIRKICEKAHSIFWVKLVKCIKIKLCNLSFIIIWYLFNYSEWRGWWKVALCGRWEGQPVEKFSGGCRWSMLTAWKVFMCFEETN